MPDVGSVVIKIDKKALDYFKNKTIKPVVGKICTIIKKEAKRSIKEDPKTGRWYVGRSGRYYQASAAGESPAIDTGSLYKSISSLVVKTAKGYEGYVGTMNSEKWHPLYQAGTSLVLEQGLKKVEQPRPFLRPALAKAVGKLQEAIYTTNESD